MNEPRLYGSQGGSSRDKAAVPESQVRALDRRHVLDRQQALFRKAGQPARGDRRPSG